MKRQIRRGVYETNSSSTHSITLMMKDDFLNWKNNGLFLYDGSYSYCYLTLQPEKGKLYTSEEAEKYIKSNKYYSGEEDVDFTDYNFLAEEYGFVHFEYENEYLESFYKEFTTPSGETVVAFGEYGYDG